MLRGLRDKVTTKVNGAIAATSEYFDSDDTWDAAMFSFREGGEDFLALGGMIKDYFSRNHSQFSKELSRDAERRNELQAFLAPDKDDGKGGTVPFKYDALPDGHLLT
jgi:hypothetical protein